MEFYRGPEVESLHRIRDRMLQLKPGYCSAENTIIYNRTHFNPRSAPHTTNTIFLLRVNDNNHNNVCRKPIVNSHI